MGHGVGVSVGGSVGVGVAVGPGVQVAEAVKVRVGGAGVAVGGNVGTTVPVTCATVVAGGSVGDASDWLIVAVGVAGGGVVSWQPAVNNKKSKNPYNWTRLDNVRMSRLSPIHF